jgi:acyl carrier protein
VTVEQEIKTELREFVSTNYLFGDRTRLPADDDSLLENGILDSTGVLELIEFLEAQFGIEVSDTETVPDNLGSIGGLTRFVVVKQSRS